MGVVPKYIHERKEELASLVRQSEVIDINCPDGHIPLPEEDRLRALDIAKNRKLSSHYLIICQLKSFLLLKQDLIR